MTAGRYLRWPRLVAHERNLHSITVEQFPLAIFREKLGKRMRLYSAFPR
jgi:hypothetical protein